MTERAWKIPESVLVVIYTSALDVLLIRRADADEFWQSVTGSKDALNEPLALTAAREVGASWPKRTQRVQWMQRFISFIEISGPTSFGKTTRFSPS